MSIVNLNGPAGPDVRRQLDEARDRRAVALERVRRLEAAVKNENLASTVRQTAEEQLPIAQSDLDVAEADLRRATTGVARSHVGPISGNGFDPTGVLAQQLETPEARETLRRVAAGGHRIGDMPLGQIPREQLAGMLAPGSDFQAAATGGIVTAPPAGSLGPYRGIIQAISPPTALLDLLPSNTYDHGALPYTQEVINTDDPGPAPAAPGTTKPAAGVEYEDATTASTTIAGWIKVNRQDIADNGYLQPSAQARLLFKLRQAIEKELVSGDGSVSDVANVPGIKGILNTTGIGSVAAAVGELVPDAILDGIGTLLASGATPTAVVLNLNDWKTLLKTKSSGSGEYVASPFLSQVRQMWGVNFLPSVALAAGTALVVDTGIAATVLFRSGAEVRISDSDQDDFVSNRLTLLVEARVLFPVWVPAAVCEVTGLGA